MYNMNIENVRSELCMELFFIISGALGRYLIPMVLFYEMITSLKLDEEIKIFLLGLICLISVLFVFFPLTFDQTMLILFWIVILKNTVKFTLV